MIRFSRTPAFHFEAVRAVWAAPFDGADYGEVASVMSRVRRGDFESWYRQWARQAHAVAVRASESTDLVSRGKGMLRAANYLREAEFFLEPADPRRGEAATLSRTWFDAGLRALGVDFTRGAVPFDGGEMETLLLRPDGPSRGTL